jgi:hypothetical protein
MSKRDPVSSRLAKQIELFSRTRPAVEAELRAEFGDVDFCDFTQLSGPPDELMLSDVPVLQAAFNAFGLDPEDPIHWRLLLGAFAEMHFGDRCGRPTIPEDELMNLIGDYRAAKAKWPDRSEKKVCELMCSRHSKTLFGGRYDTLGPEGLRKKLRRARKLEVKNASAKAAQAKHAAEFSALLIKLLEVAKRTPGKLAALERASTSWGRWEWPESLAREFARWNKVEEDRG